MKSLLFAILVALALPAVAAAHATLVSTSPANGAVLVRAPGAVRIAFDDTVTRGPGIEAIRNGGGSILAAKPRIEGGKTLVLPVRRGLPDGDYSVRWAIISDDGHLESGVLAFAVGTGRPKPVASLAPEAAGPRPPDVIARWLFLAGVLGAAGIALFALLGRVDAEPVALVLASSAVLAALGAGDESHRVGLHTRAGDAFVAGSAYAVAVALVAGAALLEPRARRPSLWLALPLVAVPTAAGHALDRGLSRVNVAADVLHVAGAAAWVGALLGLVVTRRRDVRLAAAGVALLTVTGVVRASYELLHLAQLWETSYGRALLVKTGLLLAAVAVGMWRRPRVELVLVAGILVAVGVLTLERPGRNATPPARAAVPSEPQPAPPPPPADAVVAAREIGLYGVGVESEPSRRTVIVFSPAGGGASGLAVTVDGTAATACGSGCYRVDGEHGDTTDVVVDGLRASIVAPADAPVADVARMQRWIEARTSVAYVEHLASDPEHSVTASWRFEAPNRVAYTIAGGAQGIVVGDRRWDRARAGAAWVESPQTPVRQPATQWERATNVHAVAPGVLTFADPTIPAFFTLHVRDGKPTLLEMTAPAHFMRDRYVSFDSAPRIRPPR
ncbi:MAG: copper resistance protein CopC [Actinomycetota bacterium]